MTGQDTVENSYRLHLGWALTAARARAGEADDPFVVTRRAMGARAWVGGLSDAFSQECAAKGSYIATGQLALTRQVAATYRLTGAGVAGTPGS